MLFSFETGAIVVRGDTFLSLDVLVYNRVGSVLKLWAGAVCCDGAGVLLLDADHQSPRVSLHHLCVVVCAVGCGWGRRASSRLPAPALWQTWTKTSKRNFLLEAPLSDSLSGLADTLNGRAGRQRSSTAWAHPLGKENHKHCWLRWGRSDLAQRESRAGRP